MHSSKESKKNFPLKDFHRWELNIIIFFPSILTPQISLSCLGSPCLFGCVQDGANGPICSCPNGYRTVGQGHCLSTINQISGAYPQNGFNVYNSGQQPPLYVPEDYSSTNAKGKKYLSTEGCFSCRVSSFLNLPFFVRVVKN